MGLERTISHASERHAAARDGRTLEVLTLSWNFIEAFVAITAGVAAGSVALLEFGADSIVESLSGAVLLWRLLVATEDDEHRDRLALRLVGLSLLVVAAYIGTDAGLALLWREAPDPSPAGIGLALASLLVMPLLARASRLRARRSGSA